MIEWMRIGSSPAEEDCAQVGSDNYHQRARMECKVFINQLRRAWPDGRFKITSNPHDSGTYFDVAVGYNPDDPVEHKLAMDVEANTPANWDEAALTELRRCTGNGTKYTPEEEQTYAEGLDQSTLEGMVMQDQDVLAIDGCNVEPDGTCQHGYKSPLLILGVI